MPETLTWPFLQIYMGHMAYRHGHKTSNKPLNCYHGGYHIFYISIDFIITTPLTSQTTGRPKRHYSEKQPWQSFFFFLIEFIYPDRSNWYKFTSFQLSASIIHEQNVAVPGVYTISTTVNNNNNNINSFSGLQSTY